MQTKIEGAPSFAYIHVDLDPGESIIAESGAMASMDAALDMKAELNGGFFSALGRYIAGGEALFSMRFTNRTDRPRRVTLVQWSPGDIKEIALENGALYLQQGAYIASTPGLRVSVKWAGFTSFFARQGLFRLMARGTGKLWFGGYGGILFKDVEGAHIVDSTHLLAYEPSIRIRLRLAGGLFSSFFGGEGVVMRVEGRGKIAVQTRSLVGLRDYFNPKLY